MVKRAAIDARHAGTSALAYAIDRRNGAVETVDAKRMRDSMLFSSPTPSPQ